MILYVVRRKSDGYYHCMGSGFCKNINQAKLYVSPKTAIRHYYSYKDEYDNLEVVEIKINEELSIDITSELYKKYSNANYEAYLRNKKRRNEK